MKKIVLTIIAIITLVSLSSCDEENSPIFTAQEDVDGIEFVNSFAANYLLSEDTEDNIADRLIWESADHGTATNITYELQASTDASFSMFEILGTTSENNLAVTIANLLEFAKDLGLDSDPVTTVNDLPNNTGEVFFRVKSNVGTGDALETFSNIQPINITWIEIVEATTACDAIFAVGDALSNIGWNFIPAGEVTCDSDVLTAKLTLAPGTFRFFEVSGDWGTGLNYTHFINEGFTIDANFEDALDADNNFMFIGEAGIYTLTIDNINKTIALTPSSSLWAVGGAVPGGWGFNDDTIEFVESTPNIWSASITLTNDVFRFFQIFDVWDTNNNFTFYEDQEFTIDSNLESDGTGDANFNFVGTPGTYILTINAIDKTITLE